jgi:molybdopterin synthase catalytic subunit
VVDELIKVGPEDFGFDELVAPIKRAETGAIVVFVGTVRSVSKGRSVSHLHFESYEEMAASQIAGIVEDARKKFGIQDASVIHRTGDLQVGDNIVGIATSAEHRKEAYEASRFIIDELKNIAAIWKKEIGEDGGTWVEED